jgi:hypothetical protein
MPLEKNKAMPKSSINIQQILSMIGNLSDKHILKRMPQQYVSDFAKAAAHVYDPVKIQAILQRRFYLPNDSAYKEDSYLQSASELSVANYIKARQVADFEINKPVNPNNKKDVDVYYRIGSTKVSLEVKCPFEEEQAPLPVITALPAGRLPGYDQTLARFTSVLGAGSSSKILKGKNRDNRMKDALVSAHGKFRSDPELDDLNILFFSCGNYYRMSEWHGYLFGSAGLFTPESFHPPENYCSVDLVVLSNLKYRHQFAPNFPAWSLDDVLLIPIRNPLGRRNVFSKTVDEGLSIFNHYRKEFLAGRIVTSGKEEIQDLVDSHTKVTRFVLTHLSDEQQKRFFPVTPIN